jgi:hypothetical protein
MAWFLPKLIICLINIQFIKEFQFTCRSFKTDLTDVVRNAMIQDTFYDADLKCVFTSERKLSVSVLESLSVVRNFGIGINTGIGRTLVFTFCESSRMFSCSVSV